jgi:hypothetical protein
LSIESLIGIWIGIWKLGVPWELALGIWDLT